MEVRARWLALGVVAACGLIFGGAAAADSGSQWNSAGGDQQNTRFQANEKTIGVGNVAQLATK